ncbi:hypothetical protein GBAR_LOCUS11271 [Geodia barretti]|uniref:Dynein assembly factor 3 C-terminal domain-containing protein n=1 Tax=Geodia barretti TaxID=519541 RepID=A0AA35WLC7_GEOBA|nr:hypothetical protein GBAR_LOCUS11271 [Geodia barretti]
MVHHLTSGVDVCFSQHSIILLETARFMLELKKEQKLVYTRKVTTMAHNIGYTSEIHNSTKLEDLNYLAFSRARTS